MASRRAFERDGHGSYFVPLRVSVVHSADLKSLSTPVWATLRIAAFGAVVLAVPVAARAVEPRGQTAALCASGSGKVHEEEFVSLGGIGQWVTIKGDSCANPVILFL